MVAEVSLGCWLFLPSGAPQLVTPEVEAGLDAVLGQDDDSQREGGSDDSDADDDMADGQGDMSGLDDEGKGTA